MKINFELGFQILFIVVIVGLLAGISQPSSHVPVLGVTTQNVSNARRMAIAAKLYAVEHQGQFPARLNDLIPDYIRQEDWNGLRFSPRTADDKPHAQDDWLYFGALLTERDIPNHLLLAAPQAITDGKKQRRVVSYDDSSTTIIPEEKYQDELRRNRQPGATPTPAH